jgi:hypothetical protein
MLTPHGIDETGCLLLLCDVTMSPALSLDSPYIIVLNYELFRKEEGYTLRIHQMTKVNVSLCNSSTRDIINYAGRKYIDLGTGGSAFRHIVHMEVDYYSSQYAFLRRWLIVSGVMQTYSRFYER